MTVKIITKNYFEGPVYWFGWACLPLSLSVFLTWYVGVIFLVIGVTIITTSYRLDVDLTNKYVYDYLFFWGLKTSMEKDRFGRLSKVFINQAKYTQRMHMASLSSAVSGYLYTGYLQTDQKTYLLSENTTLETVQKACQAYARQLGVSVEMNFS